MIRGARISVVAVSDIIFGTVPRARTCGHIPSAMYKENKVYR
mgnify:CR=1 FL=1